MSAASTTIDTETDTTASTPAAGPAVTYAGGCHCGAVRFEARLDLTRPVSRCNCTLCIRRGISAAMTTPEAFRLVAGDEGALGEYPRNPVVGSYRFCPTCGIQ